MDELTPLLEDLLTIVRDTCAPAATGWQQALLQRLYAEFYSPVVAGGLIAAADEERKHLRLLAVERRLSASPAPTDDGQTTWRNRNV